MRHLELPVVRLDEDDIKSECDIDIKDEDLEDLDIKDELIGLGAFDEALQSVVDFHSYDKKDLVNERTTEDNSRLCSDFEISTISITNKDRNRQKALQPGQIDIEENEHSDTKPDERSAVPDDEWKSHWGIKCAQCEQTWTSKAAFDAHYRSAYGLTPAYTCSYCDKTTDKYSTFRSHCYRHAMEGRHRCTECGKGFSLRSMLTAHLQAKHAHIKPYMCEQCGKAFTTRGGLRAHQQRRHGDGAPTQANEFPCGECGKVLRTRGGLTAHLAVHRLGRRFMCDLCGKTFTQKVNMQQHVRQHAGDRPWRCDVCGKSFGERSHLARHRQFHSDLRPWRCETCGRTYKTERCLKVHGLVHAERRPHACHTCGKGFLSTTKLRQHLNVHTGERPYKCQYCERTFTNYPNWLKHTRRRHAAEADKLRTQRTAVVPSETMHATKNTYVEPVATLPPFSLQFEAQQLHHASLTPMQTL